MASLSLLRNAFTRTTNIQMHTKMYEMYTRHSLCVSLRTLHTATWRTFPRVECQLSKANRKTVFAKNWLCGWFPQSCGFHISYPLNQTKVTEISLDNDILKQYIQHLVEKFDCASARLMTESAQKEDGQIVTRLGLLVAKIKEYQRKKKELMEVANMVKGLGEQDKEMKILAEMEQAEITEKLNELESEILSHLVASEPADHNDIILELTAGVGGQEAMLFTDEMCDMYLNYAAYKGWEATVIEHDASETGGLRKASITVSGESVYSFLKYEAGVHRVQRVPKTEKSGRIHTSTMKVAVLPQPNEIDIIIKPQDLKIDTFRAGGAGGQHVNTTESAVRITHLPTGTVAECQTERSQIRNRETALRVLRSRLYEKEVEQQLSNQKSTRIGQVGMGARSDKIRTYQYNQDRITDHRVGKNMFNVYNFLEGGDSLEEMIETLIEARWQERLLSILEDFNEEQKNRQVEKT